MEKISYRWHRLYQSYTGRFDPYYFPEIIYSLKLEAKYIRRNNVLSFSDKNILDIITGINSWGDNVRIPFSHVMCIDGVFYDDKRKIISYEKVVEKISNIGEVILKGTVDTGSGKGVYLCNFIDGEDIRSKKNIKELLKEMNNNWVIQERIRPNLSYKTLYPHSINTIRVVTYILETEIRHGALAMRIGQGGSHLDNAHAGGMFVGIDEDGNLGDRAFTEHKKVFLEHPDTKIRFKGYKVDKIEEIINVAKELHKNLPKFRFVSWDFTVDEDDKIVIIETNFGAQAVWLGQIANGKVFFGEDTEKVIKMAKMKK